MTKNPIKLKLLNIISYFRIFFKSFCSSLNKTNKGVLRLSWGLASLPNDNLNNDML